jgi:hypothetical protein
MMREPTDRVAGSVAIDRGADGDRLPVAAGQKNNANKPFQKPD